MKICMLIYFSSFFWDTLYVMSQSFIQRQSSFTIRPTLNKNSVWRNTKAKFYLRNLVPSFKSGYETVSAGVFSVFMEEHRLYKLMKRWSRTNISKYLMTTLYLGLFKNVEAILIFISARQLQSTSSKFYSCLIGSKHVNVMKFPTKSPDLNSIKMLGHFWRVRFASVQHMCTMLINSFKFCKHSG